MFEGFDGWLRIKDDSLASYSIKENPLTVSEFIEQCDFTLETEFADVYIEGEVASFKINQGKWVFFDLKEADYNLNCFMVLSQLNIALTDGMKIRIKATPKVTNWGRFSLTVHTILPIGEGSIKKSFELLKKKLAMEGLFNPAKKRLLPDRIAKIGVISSTGAAGYHDFLKILGNRWGDLSIYTVNTTVQGIAAPEQIIRALDFFNQQNDVDVIAIIRGGGSADDLSAFNDEHLARALAASRIPTITGIGHEVDESLCDLVADVQASTPSNAAELLTKDRRQVQLQINTAISRLPNYLAECITKVQETQAHKLQQVAISLGHQVDTRIQHLSETKKLLASLNPENILRRGYAIVRGKLSPGEVIEVSTYQQTITAEIKHVEKRPK